MRVLIVDAGQGGSSLFKTIHAIQRMNILAVIDNALTRNGLELVLEYYIPFSTDWNENEHKQNTFIVVNCAAITESLLEHELFGYKDGGFSGAKTVSKKM